MEYVPFPTSWLPDEIMRAYADDPAIDRNFFHHPPHRVKKIRDALRKKAEVTMSTSLRRVDLLQGVPAAGAR